MRMDCTIRENLVVAIVAGIISGACFAFGWSVGHADVEPARLKEEFHWRCAWSRNMPGFNRDAAYEREVCAESDAEQAAFNCQVGELPWVPFCREDRRESW